MIGYDDKKESLNSFTSEVWHESLTYPSHMSDIETQCKVPNIRPLVFSKQTFLGRNQSFHVGH